MPGFAVKSVGIRNETAELYMEADEPSSGTATLELRNVYVRLYRW